MSKVLFTDATLATMCPAHAAEFGLVERAAVAVNGETIQWCGPIDALPNEYQGYHAEGLEGRLITPSLIDCHTHLVYGGNRANEFALRQQGASYADIARAGGGIAATVNATNKESYEQLLQSALNRADALISEGVSDIEVKSGYGLTLEGELSMLRVARDIEKHRKVTIHKTFLGAHALPETYKQRADAYIDEVCIPAIEQGHKENLIDAVDGFCESIAFSSTQIERVFSYAKSLGIPVKLHAEQLSNSGGAALAAQYHALSADHLEYIDESGIKAMASAGTSAVLLPGAFYFLKETRTPPINLFRKHNIPMAIATDCNPGSSPMTSLLLAANMASVFFSLTVEEALAGITQRAANALGLKTKGQIREGFRADLAIWNAEHPQDLIYHIGAQPLYKRIYRGSLC